MRPTHGLLLSAALLVAPAHAQTTFKCRDARGQTTYSNEPCEKQGLRDAGPVADRTTVMPFTTAKPAAKEAPKDAARKDDPEGLKPGPSATVKPVAPIADRLLNIK